jgi:RNA polymerase sigma factor (sigma-70 family)
MITCKPHDATPLQSRADLTCSHPYPRRSRMSAAPVRWPSPEEREALIWNTPTEQLAQVQRESFPANAAAALPWLQDLSDETLALAIQKDFLRKPAFEELFVNRYSPTLRIWFRRLGARNEEGSDLLQQLLLKFYDNRLGTYQPVRPFRAYLHRAAYNLWLQKTYRSPAPATGEAIGAEPTPAPGPDRLAMIHELEEMVEGILTTLPEDQQTVFRGMMAGKNALQIAEETGRSKQAVFMLLFRARQALKRHLAGADLSFRENSNPRSRLNRGAGL